MQSEMIRLSNLHKGDSAVIESFSDDRMKQKLLEMGCLPGETIKIDRFAPLGGPMAIQINNSMLGIRMDEAEAIFVKRI